MKVLFTSSRSISVELENNRIYESEKPFRVLVNGETVHAEWKRNVISVYGLTPDTVCRIEADGQEAEIRTEPESVTLNVRDFYARGDGVSDDTEAIQAAIMCCPKEGRVLIPAGRYLVRPIFLKSHLRIELEKDAVLLGETDRHKYPILPGRIPANREEKEYYFGTWEGIAESAFAGLITGIGVRDVKLYGQGVIDGQANLSDWWVNDRVKRVAWRPRGIFLNRCEDVSFQGFTCRNTASWNQHPFFSKHVSYIDVALENPKENPNTDGIDPESCDGVDIIGCRFSVGDDCIAIKSGKLEMGRKLKTPCTDVTIRNCLMRFGHGAVTLGSELSAGLKGISVTQCRFEGTDRGLRIKSQRGRGKDAVVSDVLFDRIEMKNVKAPLVVNMFYKARNHPPDRAYVYSHEKQPVDERTPEFGKFAFRNITAEDVEWAAGAFWGLPEKPIGEIELENVRFVMKEDAEGGAAIMTLDSPVYRRSGLHFYHVGSITMKNVQVIGAETEDYILQDANIKYMS